MGIREQPPRLKISLLVSTSGWETDFTRHSLPLSEIIPREPPKDGLPPIDAPRFVSLDQAGMRLP